MELSGSSPLTRGSPTSRNPGVVSPTNEDHADPQLYLTVHDNRSHNHSSHFSKPDQDGTTPTIAPGADCDRRRPEESGHPRMANMSSSLISQTVTPFLREHIPNLYAPISKVDNDESKATDPNSKFCYRHRPDSKCRKAADESKMGMIQRELDQLSPADRQAITHVWSLFSAAPSKHRVLMLKGVLQTACFPQLSVVSREIGEQLKIDFITALPVEISQKILCHLDTVSLCKAAQVSRRWRQLADDDQVWLHMCEQHVNKKCSACGWGLPLLERRRLRDWTRQRRLAQDSQEQRAIEELTSPPVLHAPNTPRSPSPPLKRDASHIGDNPAAKRQRVARAPSENSIWKNIYRDRFKVGSNWKYGRATLSVLQGHTNGVTCLQMDDNMLASGSYDATVRIWDLNTGMEQRVLRGHQAGIRCLQYDDSKLVSGSLDGVIKIWNHNTGECLSTLQGHTSGVITVHFDGELLASGSMDRSIKVFNFQTKVSYCLRGHSDWVNSVRLDSESRTLLSASDDCTVKLWDLDSKTVVRTFVGHVGHVQQVLPMPEDFEPDVDVITCSNGAADNADAVSECSSGSGSPRHHKPASVSGSQDEDVRSFYGQGFIADPSRPLPPRYLLTGGLDSTIRLFDSATGKCLKTFFGHLEGIWGLAGDSLRVVTGANDACVKLWEPRSGKCERTVTGHRGPVTCVGLSDSRMASGSEDNEIRLYSFGSSPGPGPAVEVGTPN